MCVCVCVCDTLEISLSVISVLNELELICFHTSIAIVSAQSHGFTCCNIL